MKIRTFKENRCRLLQHSLLLYMYLAPLLSIPKIIARVHCLQVRVEWMSIEIYQLVIIPKSLLYNGYFLPLEIFAIWAPKHSILIFAFLCPSHKMARGHSVFALSVIPSHQTFVFSTPPTSLHGFEWNLVQMLYHKSKSACGEIIHVEQILAELWPLTLRIFTHFSLSSQLLLHPCMDLNETWQGCCTTSLEVHVGR